MSSLTEEGAGLESGDDALLPWWEGADVDAASVGGAVEEGFVCRDLLRRFFGMNLVFLGPTSASTCPTACE
jgi:hypothetical protein